ncbi:histidine kinase [Paenibacillus sp. CAU 1782]
MIRINGSSIEQVLERNERFHLYRMRNKIDNSLFIAKMASNGMGGVRYLEAAEAEMRQLAKLGGSGVLIPEKCDINGDQTAIIFEDFDGITLKSLMNNGSGALALNDMLKVSLALADCVGRLHKANLLIHEWSPGFFLISKDLSQAKLLAVQPAPDRMATARTVPFKRLHASWPYLSPEQSGRTGNTPDFRSDLYSLGVLLYEWFGGALPFSGEQPLDMIYQHLAVIPQPLHKYNAAIPKVVSDIVHKCLEKMPESRYKSAAGLGADVEKCLADLQQTGGIRQFPLATRDRRNPWDVAEMIFGQREERQKLIRAIGEAADSRTNRLVWIIGEDGQDKISFGLETIYSVLPADAVVAVADNKNGTALNAPYGLWRQIIEQLSPHALQLDASRFASWEEEMDECLRQLDTFGTLPASIEQAGHIHREMASGIRQLLLSFLQREQLLVLFLNHAHLSDEPSLRFLEAIITDDTVFGLLIVATLCSDTEGQWPLPFKSHLSALEVLELETEHIFLEVFTVPVLRQSLAIFLQTEADDCEELAAMLLQKTGGYPDVLKAYIRKLLDIGLLSYNEQENAWKWDMDAIQMLHIHDDLAVPIAKLVSELEGPDGILLGYAACLGEQFTLDELALLSGDSPETMAAWADVMTKLNMIGQVIHKPSGLHFLHPIIWAEARNLVPPGDQAAIHKQIGLLLAERKLPNCPEEQLLTVIEHLKTAASLLSDAERSQLALLYLEAGQLAKNRHDSTSAATMMSKASETLDDSFWLTHYDLMWRCYEERIKAEIGCRNFDQALDLSEMLHSRSKTLFEQVRVFIMKIQLELYRENNSVVLALAEDALDLLGYKRSHPSSMLSVHLRWKKLNRELKAIAKENIEEVLPPMTDPMLLLAARILFYASQAAFSSDKKVWLRINADVMEMTLKHGLTPEAGLGFVGYAILLNYVRKQYKAAHLWSVIACRIAKPDAEAYVQVFLSYSLCFQSWRSYDPQFIQQFDKEVYRHALDSGNLSLFSSGAFINGGFKFQFSYPLQQISEQLAAHAKRVGENDLAEYWRLSIMLAELIARLTGHKHEGIPFPAHKLDIGLVSGEATGDRGSTKRQFLCSLQYISGYILEDYDSAWAALTMANDIPDHKAVALSDPSVYYYYTILVLKELYAKGTGQERALYRKHMKQSLRELKGLSREVPAFFRHKYLLAEAEVARTNGKFRQAEHFYQQAMAHSRSIGYLHDIAIISECYARYHESVGNRAQARFYMSEAYEAFSEWGAFAKTSLLETRWGHLLQIRQFRAEEPHQIDYHSVMMSAQAISSEMKMDRLLPELIKNMIKNAGAEYGALLFGGTDGWRIVIRGTMDNLSMESLPLAESNDIVLTAAIQLAMDKREAVVLHNAENSNRFGKHNYVLDNKVKSVMCLPVEYRQQLAGVLYLENNLSAGVFTQKRQDVLQMLVSQCAISLANAALYADVQYLKDNLEEQVAERTLELEKSIQANSETLAEMTLYAERNRIAQEIHDIVGHTLTSTVLQIEAGKRLMHVDVDQSQSRLGEAQNLIRHSLSEIRNSVHMLKEDKYYDIGQALRDLIHSTEQHAGARIQHKIENPEALSFMHKKVIYHALQEGLTNGLRHGLANEFSFSLLMEGNLCRFTLQDNGAGMSRIEEGFGLRMMRDRVRQLKGNLHIQSEPGQGFALFIEMPY